MIRKDNEGKMDDIFRIFQFTIYWFNFKSFEIPIDASGLIVLRFGRKKSPYTNVKPEFLKNNIIGGGKEEGKDEDGEDGIVMNNLIHDIKEGFIHRRLPDGGFKVISN